MYKILFLFILLPCFQLVAQENLFRDFVSIHDWTSSQEGVYEVQASMKALGKKEITADNCVVIFSKTAKAISIVQNGRQTLFLNHPLGTWVTQKNQASPLKISGGYNVYGVMNVDDIIGLEIGKTYKVERSEQDGVLLSSIKKTTYPFILLKSIDKGYEVIFMDRKQIPVKKGIYTVGELNKIKMFTTIKFFDLIIDTNRTSEYTVQSVKQSGIHVETLAPERFKIIFNLIHQ